MESLIVNLERVKFILSRLEGSCSKVGAGEIGSNSSSFFCFPVYQFLWTRGEGLQSLGTLAPS